MATVPGHRVRRNDPRGSLARNVSLLHDVRLCVWFEFPDCVGRFADGELRLGATRGRSNLARFDLVDVS